MVRLGIMKAIPPWYAAQEMFMNIGHPSFKPKSSLHFRDFAFSQRNWKLEIRKKHINSGVLSNFQFQHPIFRFDVRFSTRKHTPFPGKV